MELDEIAGIVVFECGLGFLSGALGAAIGSMALLNEKYRVKQFLDTPYVKRTLNPEFAALSYYQVAKISAIFMACISALAGMAFILVKKAGYDDKAQENAGIAVICLSAIAAGIYLYTRQINILKIGISLSGTLSCGFSIIAAFAIKYFTQKKLFG
jgi:hypothetical protein